MKVLKRLAVLSLCVVALTGCTQSSFERQEAAVEASATAGAGIVGPGGVIIEEDPVVDSETRAPIVEENPEPVTMFQWEQVYEDSEYMFEDPDFYELGVDMTYEADEDAKTIKLMWVLKNGATEEDGLEYATELVQKFNDILAIQRTDYELSNKDSFGTVWNTFALTVEVSTEDGTMLVEKSYKAGDKIDLPLPQYNGDGPSAATEAAVSPGMAK